MTGQADQVRPVNTRLRPGYRRAVPTPPVVVLDPGERAQAMAHALVDPDREWRLEEFDGAVFVQRGVVRGPEARARYLAGRDVGAASPA